MYLFLILHVHVGDPALLHKMIVEGDIDMGKLQECPLEELVQACSSVGIPTNKKSKVISRKHLILLLFYYCYY